jgi:hypothetical protein
MNFLKFMMLFLIAFFCLDVAERLFLMCPDFNIDLKHCQVGRCGKLC